jgi:hypothetical protein
MDRRAYLTTLGASAVAVSGCSGDSTADGTATGTDGTATPTERATATPEDPSEQTPTEDPPDPTPTVTDAGLLLDRGEYASLGDIDSVGQGGPLVVGVEYELPASDGSARGLVETRIFDGDGVRVDANTTEVDVVADGDSVSRRAWFAFDTADWERASYTAEVLVNADSYGTTTSAELSVEVVEPLDDGEVEMYIAEFPDEAVASEEFDWTVGFRNLSDRDSSVVTDTVTLEPAGDDPVVFDIAYRENVPAGEATQVDVADNRFNYPGSYTYRIAPIDAEVSFTIQPPEE